MDTADFVIVGGGIAGTSAGCHLAAHGRVVLFESEIGLGYHSSGRSAAQWTAAYEQGVTRRLVEESLAFYQSPPDGLFDTPVAVPMPVLYVARSDQVERLAIRTDGETGLIHEIDPDEALQLCPVLEPGYAAAARLEPSALALETDALVQGFARGIRRGGGEVRLGSPVTGIERRGPAWVVHAGEDRVEAPIVVNAAGAWADRVAGLAGAAPQGLAVLGRTAFLFNPPEGLDVVDLPFVVDADEEFYFRPFGPQLLGSPADEIPTEAGDARHREIDVAIGIERIQPAVTVSIRHIPSAWCGLRVFAPDRAPVVGEDPARPGFFWLAGQGGTGFMTAPAMARSLLGLIADEVLPADLIAAGITAGALAPGRDYGAATPPAPPGTP